MNYLVTGGSGFIGHNLVNTLIEQGNQVLVLDNLETAQKRLLSDKALFLKASINDDYQQLVNHLGHFKPDVIFHLAARARISPSFKEPLNTLKINAMGTANACELARYFKAKLVYAASSSVYAGPYKNPYTFSKWQGEEIGKMYHHIYGISVANVRFFNVYGPGHIATG